MMAHSHGHLPRASQRRCMQKSAAQRRCMHDDNWFWLQLLRTLSWSGPLMYVNEWHAAILAIGVGRVPMPPESRYAALCNREGRAPLARAKSHVIEHGAKVVC